MPQDQIPFAQASREVLQKLDHDNETRLLYHDMAAAAQYGNGVYEQWGVSVEPGQLLLGIVDIERRYRWTRKKARHKIDKLSSLGVISSEVVHCYRSDRPDAHQALRITILDGVNGRVKHEGPARGQPGASLF